MSESLELFSQTLIISAVLSAIPLSVVFIIGLVTAIIQTLTQVQEQTISFFPKVIGMVVTLFFFGSWIINKVVNLMMMAFENISKV